MADLKRIQFQQVGIDLRILINSNLLELNPPDSYRDIIIFIKRIRSNPPDQRKSAFLSLLNTTIYPFSYLIFKMQMSMCDLFFLQEVLSFPVLTGFFGMKDNRNFIVRIRHLYVTFWFFYLNGISIHDGASGILTDFIYT